MCLLVKIKLILHCNLNVYNMGFFILLLKMTLHISCFNMVVMAEFFHLFPTPLLIVYKRFFKPPLLLYLLLLYFIISSPLCHYSTPQCIWNSRVISMTMKDETKNLYKINQLSSCLLLDSGSNHTSKFFNANNLFKNMSRSCLH